MGQFSFWMAKRKVTVRAVGDWQSHGVTAKIRKSMKRRLISDLRDRNWEIGWSDPQDQTIGVAF